MTTDLIAQIFSSHLSVGILAGFAAGFIVSELLPRGRRYKRKRASAFQRQAVRPVSPSPANSVGDAGQQLMIVLSSAFAARPILNRSEMKLYLRVRKLVSELNPGWTVMAQAPLGEMLRCEADDAFRCINSKRVDLLLVDEEFMPAHAIEYQGKGHHQSDAAARDAVKREALRRAGVGYHEVVGGQTTPADLRRLLETIVPPARAETLAAASDPATKV